MNEHSIPIHIPKEMVNDDAYLVAALFADPGDLVTLDQPLAELETSKASFTVPSPGDGYFHPFFKQGDMVKVGAVFGEIRTTDTVPLDKQDSGAQAAETRSEPDPRFSRPAWEAFLASGLPLEAFSGIPHVKRDDVIARAGKPATVGAGLPDFAAMPEQKKADVVVLLGGGGHARECIDIIELVGGPRILGIVDTRTKAGSTIAGHVVLGDNSVLPGLVEAGIRNLVLAYGISGNHPDRGKHYRELLAQGHTFPVLVHPKAIVSRQARLSQGTQVMGGSLVGSNAIVGEACIINSNAVVSHDCVLASNVHIAPGAILAGGVHVGEDTVIGMGATVYMRARIGAGVIVFNGANIFADVPDGTVVQGDWRG